LIIVTKIWHARIKNQDIFFETLGYGQYAIPSRQCFYHGTGPSGFCSGEKANAPFMVSKFTPAQGNYAHPEMLVAMIKAAYKYTPKACTRS